MDKRGIALSLIPCLLFVAALVGHGKIKSDREKTEADLLKKQQDKILTELREQVERAKEETGDPCNTSFYELIWRPELSGKPILVFMGQEIEWNTFDRSYWKQRAVGDKIEFWEDGGPPPADPPRKIAEKYNEDSLFCRG